MSNSTSTSDGFVLPTYTLHRVPPLLPFISDVYLLLIVPLVVYWVTSLFFEWVERGNYLAGIRLHTSEEERLRNPVSRAECLRNVILNQVIQTTLGLVLTIGGEGDWTGKDDYHIAVWATRIGMARRLLPSLLSVSGVDVKTLLGRLGGIGLHAAAESTTDWDLHLASLGYWYAFPVVQWIIALAVWDRLNSGIRLS